MKVLGIFALSCVLVPPAQAQTRPSDDGFVVQRWCSPPPEELPSIGPWWERTVGSSTRLAESCSSSSPMPRGARSRRTWTPSARPALPTPPSSSSPTAPVGRVAGSARCSRSRRQEAAWCISAAVNSRIWPTAVPCALRPSSSTSCCTPSAWARTRRAPLRSRPGSSRGASSGGCPRSFDHVRAPGEEGCGRTRRSRPPAGDGQQSGTAVRRGQRKPSTSMMSLPSCSHWL